MKLKNLSTLLRAGAMAALFVVGTSVAASAATVVNFTTTGDFGGGNSFLNLGPDANGDTAKLTYLPVAGGIVVFPDGFSGPFGANFGNFDLDYTGGLNQAVLLPGYSAPFSLTIWQTAPGVPGSGSFGATVAGNLVTVVAANGTNLKVVWNTPEVTIGEVIYHLDDVSLTHPGLNNGITSVQGDVSISTVPEPATMMLLGTGLLAAFRARRKQTTV